LWTPPQSSPPASMRPLRVQNDHLQFEKRLRPGFLLKDPRHKLKINPQYLDDQDAETIVDTIKAILEEPSKYPHFS